MEIQETKIVSFNDLSELRNRFTDRKIVHCHGVFDVLHAGHLAYFESAKKFGDLLVVTVTEDRFVNKGPGRPYFNSIVRARMLAALQVVDYVCVSTYPTAVPSIKALKPNFYVKGPDYKDKSADPTGAIFEEESAAQSGGGELVFTNDATLSSSQLINEFFNPWTEHQQKIISEVKQAGGLDKIIEQLDKLGSLSLLCVGEPIVDTYVFCQPESISSKSPSISARYTHEEDYAGGTLAIANHTADFVKGVTLMFTHGGEDYFNQLLKTKLNSKINLQTIEVEGIPTPRKTRYIEASRSQRMFELTNLRSDQWLNNDPLEFANLMLKSNSSFSSENSLTVLADFGHGLFENKVLSACKDLRGFVALNVQTNSSNFGFNPFTKHTRFDYLSIDTKEARMAYHDRYSSGVDLARQIRSDLKSKGATASITLGSNGSIYFPSNDSQEIQSPAFTDVVIDATGAGDAYFVMSSMLIRTKCPDVMVPFISNVFAGLKTKIIGNKSAVSKAQLIKALTAILK